MSAEQEEEDLLDPKNMDGPEVKWAVNDIFANNKRLFMTYHVMNSGWDYMTTLGSLVGGALYGIRLGLGKPPATPALQFIASTTLGFGCFGMCAGLGLMTQTAMQGEGRNGLAWDDDGIQTRVDGLRHNFMVRVMDNSVWSGMLLAGGVMVMAGGPHKIGLRLGTYGMLQGLALGSTVGSLAGMTCVSINNNK